MELDGILVRLDHVGHRKSPVCSTNGGTSRFLCKPAKKLKGDTQEAAPLTPNVVASRVPGSSKASRESDKVEESMKELSQTHSDTLGDQSANDPKIRSLTEHYFKGHSAREKEF